MCIFLLISLGLQCVHLEVILDSAVVFLCKVSSIHISPSHAILIPHPTLHCSD